ncbi:MAG TPA: glycosyltransferase [Stellaceae bacterium]|nr:glycosyltransferase [Stellaceae bacterium]
MRKIVIPFTKGGGGHRAAANAMLHVIERQGHRWRIELLDVDKVLRPLDPFYWIFRIEGCEIYNWLLRRGWTFGSEVLIRIMQAEYRIVHPLQVLIFRRLWRKLRPDLILSVMPHINRALFDSLGQQASAAPLVTLLTDIADLPPRYWFEPQDQHFICGSDRAIEQGHAIAGPESRLWRVSGMVIHPKFYDPRTGDRKAQRVQLGLDPDLPTGMVLFGGYGSKTMIEIARRVEAEKIPVQLIFLCGRNRKLGAKLRALKVSFPIHVQEFTDDVGSFMGLCDFFIGKPGPASISEALAMRLPTIVQDNALMTLAQERYNAEWLVDRGVGIAVRRIRDVPQAISRLLEPATYAQMVRQIETLTNRAVFEVPAILEQIFHQPPASLGRSYERVGADTHQHDMSAAAMSAEDRAIDVK